MDMDESSLVIMEMDTIRRKDSLGDITPRDLFHIGCRRKIPLFPINIYREIRMMMTYIRSWCEYIGCEYTDNE
jgi:hypothetical protein